MRELSDRLVEAQRPIRVLNAIQWDESVGRSFIDGGCRRMPDIDQAWYAANRPLGFDPEYKRAEFADLERDITRKLGQMNPLGAIMRRICREYRAVQSCRVLQCPCPPWQTYGIACKIRQ